MPTENTRARIRVAAASVIEREGAGNLTLEKVAAVAGISKGGLLYHYPSKQALLGGLLEHLLDNRANITALTVGDEVSPCALLDAMIDADFTLPDDDRVMAQGLIAASAENPELLAPAKAHVAALFSALSASRKTALQAQTVFIASQGLQFLELLGLLSAAPLRMAPKPRATKWAKSSSSSTRCGSSPFSA